MSFEDGNFEDDFDYQEGIGDLLKEKEKIEFSWVKTIIVAISLVTIVGLCFSLIFRIGKTLIVQPTVVTSQKLNYLDTKLTTSNKKEPVSIKKDSAKKAKKTTKATSSKPGSVQSDAALFPSVSGVAMKKSSYPSKENPSEGLHRVVVAAFFDYSQAKNMLGKLQKKGVDGYVWTYKGGDRPVYRIQVGAFQDPESARELESRMLKKGLEAYVIQK